MRVSLRFVAVSTAVLIIAYLVAGAAAYQLLTKPLYVGADAPFALYLRSESQPELWAHTTRWQFPMLLLRSALIALVLVPFRASLVQLSPLRRTVALAALFFVLLHLSAAAPSPSNLEGLVYVRPELLSLRAFLLTQPEMLAQALLSGAGIARWAARAG
jgi:hypothetical protein